MGQLRFHLGHGFVEAINHVNRVFVLSFLHGHQQRALAVVKRQTFNFLRAVIHRGHLVQANWRGVFTRHDDLAKVFRAQHATLDLNHTVLLQRAQAAYGQVLGFGFDRVHHLIGADAERLHGLWVQVQIDFAFGAAHQ